MKKILVSLAILSLMVGVQIKAADASKAMPAIISYLLNGDSLPKVASITPANGAKNVPIDTDVVITFSKPMDTSTISVESIDFKCTNPAMDYVTYHVVINSDTKVTLKLDQPLNADGDLEYMVRIKSMIKDKEGNQLEKETTSGFTTTRYERVVVSGKNGIVKDNKTNLWWQDEEYTDAEDTAYTDNTEHGKVLFWQNAIDYCESLNYGSYSDWHLPSWDELKSIVDKKYLNPTINPVFKNIRSRNYWSSTTYASNASYAWVVRFNAGYSYWYGKSHSNYVRCVRAGQ